MVMTGISNNPLIIIITEGIYPKVFTFEGRSRFIPGAPAVKIGPKAKFFSEQNDPK